MANLWKGKGEEPTAKPPKSAASAEAYARHLNSARTRQAAIAREGQDVGPIPAVENPQRRAKAEKSFRIFCETYFPETFPLKWSADHLKVIAKMEEVVLHGGLFAIAMPRGSGKTSLSEVDGIWALLTGARKFVLLIGASVEGALENLDTIKKELETNELLAADFPEVCHPIAQLEGTSRKCAGQHVGGERTHIAYGKRVLVLPTVKGSKASGGILRVTGITGRLRGMKHKLPDGKSVRPDLVIPDDPQTDASAKSAPQSAHRERLLAGAVLGLAGPKKKIAGIMPCTVIKRGDMADNLLDRHKHPYWHGLRFKLLYQFPTNEKLWEEYAELLREELRADGDGSKATAFYKKNRKAMDAGAVVAWPERFEPGEISALQYAMNLRIKDEAAFFAEYQNEPLADTPEDSEILSAGQIAAKVSGLARSVVPLAATRLNGFIDVHKRLLYYAVGAFEENFGGSVIEYGTWPPQEQTYFTARNARRTLQTYYKTQNADAAITAGLADLCIHIIDRRWITENAGEVRMERCLVDIGDGNYERTINTFCRTGPFANVLVPAKGKGITAKGRPLHEFRIDKSKGERHGYHWILKRPPAGRFIWADTNFWKSFAHSRLAMPMGHPGGVMLYGQARTDHHLFSEHLTAEDRKRIRDEGSGRVVDEWTHNKAAKPDNHYFDCFTGLFVAASVQGVRALKKITVAQAEMINEGRNKPKPQREAVSYLNF